MLRASGTRKLLVISSKDASQIRPRTFQNHPFLSGQGSRGGRVVHAGQLALVRGEAAVEILQITGEIGGADAIRALAHQEAGELADLHELQAKLASRIATGDGGADDGGEESLLFRGGPADEMVLEVVQSDVQGGGVAAAKSTGEVVEAGPEGALARQQPLQRSRGLPCRHTPASPGSMRVSPSSMAQRSIDSDTRSSTSAMGRASTVRSIDFT